jgi:molecular chaperone GrpE
VTDELPPAPAEAPAAGGEEQRQETFGLRVVDKRWWARENGGGGDAPSGKPSHVEDLERQLADKDNLLEGCTARYQAAVAEFDRTRERLRREAAKDIGREVRRVLASFLDVVDNLDRALAVQPADQAEWEGSVLQGVGLVREQFLAALERHGVTRFDAAAEPFDPTRHDALSTAPVAAAAQDNLVIEVVKPGYLIDGEVLRPASVTVGRCAST